MPEPLAIALVAASPLVRAGLQLGLGGGGSGEPPARFDIVLAVPSLEAARARHFGAARVVVAAAGVGELLAADDGSDAGPAFVLLAAPDLPAPDLAAALAAGITVLPERSSLDTIAAAVVAAAAGLVGSTPAWLADAMAEGGRTPREAPPHELTPREQQVLHHMSEGLANREIAEALRISPHTAKFHVGQVIAKLQASSRAHAVAKAMRHGWVDA